MITFFMESPCSKFTGAFVFFLPLIYQGVLLFLQGHNIFNLTIFYFKKMAQMYILVGATHS